MRILTWITRFVVSFVVLFYEAFVLKCLWAWFVVPQLSLPEIGYIGALGLMVLIHLIKGDQAGLSQFNWDRLFLVLDSCVIDAQRADLRRAVEEHDTQQVAYAFGDVVGQVAGASMALAIGSVLHVLM